MKVMKNSIFVSNDDRDIDCCGFRSDGTPRFKKRFVKVVGNSGDVSVCLSSHARYPSEANWDNARLTIISSDRLVRDGSVRGYTQIC